MPPFDDSNFRKALNHAIDKELIADVMSQAVIDVLETIEIEEQQGEHVVGGTTAILDDMTQHTQEVAPVRQPRQRIVQRIAHEL